MKRTLGPRAVLACLLAVTAGTAAMAGAGLASAGPALHRLHSHGAAFTDAHFDKMFAEILPDGTAAQKARLKVIAKSIHADLGALHAQFGPAHQRAHALLLQPVVDRAGLEALRVEQVQQIDGASKRIVKALADAAEVLTPSQRVRLAEHLKAHAGKRE
jgi:Spy/CpxP family protein refolding chaperone